MANNYTTLELCSDGHVEVAFSKQTVCPVCDMREDKDIERKNELLEIEEKQKELEARKKEIENLERDDNNHFD